jgi:hypothetical protein
MATAATTSLAVLLSLPATVAADCVGPACDGAEQPVEGTQAILLVAILVLFGTIMAVAEARRR